MTMKLNVCTAETAAEKREMGFFSHLQTVEELSQTLDALRHLHKSTLLEGSRTTCLTLLTRSWEVQLANLEERPFAVCSPQLASRAPQRAVHPRQLAVRAQRGRAHAERAQIIGCSNKKSRQAHGNVPATKPTFSRTESGRWLRVSAAHVRKEIPVRCCRGCCSCSQLVLLQESSDSDPRGHHESAECSSGSLLQREENSTLLTVFTA